MLVRARRLGSVAVLASLAVTAASAVTLPADASGASCSDTTISVTSLNPPVFYRDKSNAPVLDSGYAGYAVTAATAHRDVWVGLSNFSAGSVLSLAPTQPSSLPLGSLAAAQTTPAFFLLASTGASTSAQTHAVTVYQGKPGTAGSTVLCTTTGGFSSVNETISAAANKLQPTFGDAAAVRVSTSAPTLGGMVTVTVDGNTGQIGSGMSGDPNALYMTPTALSSWPASAFRLVHTSLKISPDGAATPQVYTDLLHQGSLGSSARDYQATYVFAITGVTTTSSTPYPIQQISSGTQVKHTDTSGFNGTNGLIPPIAPATNPMTVNLAATTTAVPPTGGTVTFTATLDTTTATASGLDDVVATLPTGTSIVPGTSSLNGVTVPDPSVSNGVATWDGPISATSSAPAALSFQVEFPATVGTYPVSAVGQIAGSTIGTTAATDGSSPATVTVTVRAPGIPQTIDFTAPADTPLRDPAATLDATASSGLPVAFSPATPTVCTVTGVTLTLLHAGTCTVAADQAGDSTYDPAPEVTRSFAVTPAPQSITFPALAGTALDTAAPVLAATATSGLAVSYSSTTPDVCTVTDTTLTLLHAGSCTVSAGQDGDSDWLPATREARTFAVTPADQTLTVTPASDLVVGQAETLYAAATSGLPPAFTTTTPATCTVAGDLVTAVTAGPCTIDVSQSGGADWNAAPAATTSFTVAPKAQLITFPALPDITVGGAAPAPAAAASSALPVTYTTATPAVCRVTDGGAVTVVAAGTCTLTASQGGDTTTWAPAAPVSASFAVAAAPVATPAPPAPPAPSAPSGPVAQTITFPQPTALPDGSLDPVLDGTATSGLPVSYRSETPEICTVDGTMLHVMSAGTCTLTATQPGDGITSAAVPVTVSFPVAIPAVPTDAGTSSTVATNPGTVTLAGLPAGATLTVPPTTAAGIASVSVDGHSVSVVATPGFSGIITLPVVVDDGAGQALTHVTVVVSPAPAPTARVTARGAASTVTWTGSPNATGYVVSVDGRTVCTTTTATTCSVAQLLGPRQHVVITALGNDRTRSLPTVAPYRAQAPIALGTVYFATGSAHLTRDDRVLLRHVAATLKRSGLRHLLLAGYTDNRAGYRYNLALSARRAAAVATYLRHRLHGAPLRYTLTQHSYLHPVASNDSATGRAHNRRTEIAAD